MPEPSVLIVRESGVIDVPGAIPWPTQLAAMCERMLDVCGMPRRETAGEDETGQEDET